MPRYTVSKDILRYLIKAKCADYNTLKQLLESNGHRPDGIYAYIAILKKSGIVTVSKITTSRHGKRAKVGVVCLNETRLPEALIILSRGSKNE
jgi:hypothetical protein